MDSKQQQIEAEIAKHLQAGYDLACQFHSQWKNGFTPFFHWLLEQFALPRGGVWAFALCLNGFERR